MLLGITGFLRLEYNDFLWSKFFSWSFMSTQVRIPHLADVHRLGRPDRDRHPVARLVREGPGAPKLPYKAGLRDLEERRAAQQKISDWQERMNYVNVTIGILAVLGGSMFRSGL